MYKYTIILITLFLSSSNCFSKEVEIFTNNYEQTLIEIRNIGSINHSFVVHDVEAVNKFESIHSQDLPKDEASAKKIFEQRLSLYGEKRFTDDIMIAYEPMIRSFALGVEAYPAVVIDKKYVVYGTSNISKALKEYQKWILKSH